MFKKILWILFTVCVILLPFLSADVFKRETYFLYGLFSVVLLCLAVSERTCLKNWSVLIPLFLWLSIILFTSIYAVNAQAALESMGNLFFCVLVFIVLSGLNIKRKQQIALMLIATSFFISARAILQYFFVFNNIFSFLSFQNSVFSEKEFFYIADIVNRRRVIGAFVSPNLLASYLLMINIIIVSFCFAQKNRYLRFIMAALLITNCYALWLTRSIAGSLSFIFGILLFSVLFTAKNMPAGPRFKKRLMFLGLGLVILFAMLFIKRAIYDSGTDNIFLSLKGRLEFWTAALRVIAARPFQFTGLSGFGYLYRLYAPQARLESMMAHNLFLQLWVETGLSGLLAFIWLLSAIIYNGLKNFPKPQPCFKSYVFKLACLSGILAFLFHNMMDFSFFISQTAIIWWILCAFLADNNQDKNNITI
jgi:O-antigen ligase